MITSMTAFSCHAIEAEWGSATWELRTVNHRYLEMDLKLPEVLREIEGELKEIASSILRRGKVNGYLRYNPPAVSLAGGIAIDTGLLAQLSKAEKEIEAVWSPGLSGLSAIDLMKWPGVLQTREVDKNTLHTSIVSLFKDTLNGLVAMRQREGEGLYCIIESRLQEVLLVVDKIKARLPVVMAQQREKICKRIDDLALSIEPKRLEEELLFLIQKMDVSEEIDRLVLHVQEVRQALGSDRPVGRQLDFLMQELNREANTLGSKSADTEVTHAAIHLKVLIEQMREQVQNIE
ncbi:MAG: YicC family protein [Gammaproteobacteria bacterium]|jgi:uncharacterized protein (TIGR00255 family)|nr:YicC family protein [Gammaproteobacteria bacterium]